MAANSGEIVRPSVKLKPFNAGRLSSSGTPPIVSAMPSGGRRMSAAPTRRRENSRPRRLARRASNMVAPSPASAAASIAACSGAQDGDRDHDAAIGDEDMRQGLPSLPRAGRRHFQHVPPDDELDEERHVAQGLDIGGREPRDDEIRGAPRDADERADHGREHDADRRDDDGVHEADEEGPAVAVGRAIRDGALRDREARGDGRGSRSPS